MAKPSGAPGNLVVLDWAGFNGAVSYTFDDANSSQIAHYPELNGLGVKMTFFLQTGKSSAKDPIWAQALKDGHELGNHTQSHAQSGEAEVLGKDIDAATDFIQANFGVTPYTMAAPYGADAYCPLAETRFLLNRGVSNSLIAPNSTTDPFNVPCYIPDEGALATAMNSQIDSAHDQKKWRVVLVHGFNGGSDGAYHPVDIAEFTANVEHAKSFGDMWIDSFVNVGSYWRAQKAFTETAPTASADGQTYTFALPAHFPPGMCLRAKVDGGTLKQNGKELAWNDHGYYEIVLDAGPVTLSP